jgi:hypothetical protein
MEIVEIRQYEDKFPTHKSTMHTNKIVDRKINIIIKHI